MTKWYKLRRDANDKSLWHLKAVGKSFINGVSRLGGPPNGTAFPLNLGALATFAAFTAATFQESPTTDKMDGIYRLFSEFNVSVNCRCDSLWKATFMHGKARMDGGAEPFGLRGTINVRAEGPIWVDDSDKEVIYKWFTWGRPAPETEPSFWAVGWRTSVNIWHAVELRVRCKEGVGQVRIKSLLTSDFPSHKVWLNGSEAYHRPQGAFSSLWRSEPRIGEEFVTVDGTGPFAVQHNALSTAAE